MADAGFLFGPLGFMQPLDDVQPGVGVESARGRGELVTVGGVRYTQKSRFAPRSWTLGYGWKTPDTVSMLAAAAQGVVKDCWLYDVAGARANMLPPHLTVGSGSPVLVAGLPLGAIPAGTVATVPLLKGRVYTVSAWSAHAAGQTVFTTKFGTDSAVNTAAPAGSGVRFTSRALAPSQDNTLTVTVSSGANVSGLRVHEGTADGKWYPGNGTPCRVDVEDPATTLQAVWGQETRSDYQFIVREVGVPGSV